MSANPLRLALCVALLVACAEAAPDPAPEPDAVEPVAVPEPEPTDDPEERAALREWLEGCQLPLDDFTRGKVYTWTRAEQIAALRAPRSTLLSRDRSEDGRASGFDVALQDDAHPVARFLRTQRTTRRFAWIAPWATRMGWEEGDYGDRLIAIQLREGAWIARFLPGQNGDARWEVRDADGQTIGAAAVARDPGRVGFVVHFGSGQGVGGVTRQFREVVVVNEDRVQAWSVGTEEIAARLRRDAAFLERLAAYWERYPEPRPEDDVTLGAAARTRWRATGLGTSLPDLYLGCLALAGTEYVPTPLALREIVRTLEASPMETPLERAPTVRARPRPRPARIQQRVLNPW
ncbi:MAG: hypothetical protein AB8I08_23675 [Sandaracinaceae bacterium]